MNPTQLIFDKLKTVTAYGPLAFNEVTNPEGVKPDNFLVGTRQDASKNPSISTPNGYPQLHLEVVGGAQTQSGPRVFGMNDPSFTPTTHADMVVPAIVQLRFMLVHRNMVWEQQQPSEIGLEKFLNSLQPNMGLSLGMTWSWSLTRANEKSELTGGERRTVSRRLITANVRPYHSALIA